MELAEHITTIPKFSSFFIWEVQVWDRMFNWSLEINLRHLSSVLYILNKFCDGLWLFDVSFPFKKLCLLSKGYLYKDRLWYQLLGNLYQTIFQMTELLLTGQVFYSFRESWNELNLSVIFWFSWHFTETLGILKL